MNLYQKYRPKTFDEIAGNDDLVEYLEEVLKDKKTCPHVFLLSGPTGCGKTTIGRIIAKELGCAPVDFVEINTADFRGIDTARELIRSSRFHGLGGGIRVWLIDEVHKMTGDAQSALLKLLEDTSPHTYFVLCTTEPEKLLKTIQGRCIDLKVKPLRDQEMFALLKRIVTEEEKKLSREIYDQIIQDCFGLPRNAIQILERVLKASPERQLEIATQSAAQQSKVIDLCRALIDRSPWKKVRGILNGLKEEEPESVRRNVLGYVQGVLLNGDNDRAAFIMEMFLEPFYNTGFPGLVFACYSVIKG